MSAPKRTQLVAGKVPESFRRKVLAYAGTNVAFQKVKSRGFNGELLWRCLWVLARLKRIRAPRHWYALPGITPRTLLRFPDRVRALAAEIEQLNQRLESDELYQAAAKLIVDGAGTWRRERIPNTAPPSPASCEAALRSLNDLPESLRLYADYVSFLRGLVTLMAPKAAKRVEGMHLDLPEAAKQLTGKPHWDAVATLLTAAYAAVGSDTIVDPKSLQMQHSRRSRKK